jgi:hypothetical protein
MGIGLSQQSLATVISTIPALSIWRTVVAMKVVIRLEGITQGLQDLPPLLAIS